MVDWWNGLDITLKLLYCIAVPATLILIIQTILSFIGGLEGGTGVDVSDTSGIDFSHPSASFDASGDISGSPGDPGYTGESSMSELADGADTPKGMVKDHTGDGGNPADSSILRMITLQGIVAFLTVFSWSSIAAISSGASPLLSCLIGIVFGVLAMYVLAKLFQLTGKLTENGSLNLQKAVGESGNVYIPIPPAGQGEGKVNLYYQGRYIECSAISHLTHSIPTGATVRVTDVRNDTLVVEEDK